jgi:hypothetical protein
MNKHKFTCIIWVVSMSAVLAPKSSLIVKFEFLYNILKAADMYLKSPFCLNLQHAAKVEEKIYLCQHPPPQKKLFRHHRIKFASVGFIDALDGWLPTIQMGISHKIPR